MFLKRLLIPLLIFMFSFFIFFSFNKSKDNKFEDKFNKCSLLETSRLRMECYSVEFEKDLPEVGVEGLLLELEKLNIEDDRSESGGITKCHDAAHSIGMIAGMNSTDIEKTFSSCTNMCGFGCHMGVIEGYFHINSKDLNNFPEICRKSSHVYSCVHAVGHYAAHLTKDLDKSLSYCDMISEIEYRGHCTSGVFMELFEQPIHADTSFSLPNNLPIFCNSLKGVHKSFCFTMSGFYEYLRTGSFEDGIKMCNQSPEKDLCFNNYSKALYYKENGSAQKMYDFCTKIPNQFLGNCQDGVLNASVLSDPILRHGFEFCGLYVNENRSSCFLKIGSLIEGSGGSYEKRKTLCENLTVEDKESCLTE